MTKRITRRQFIQAGGLAGTAMALSGCTINLQKYEKIEPYVVPPEEALPGESVWYATTCRQCAAGCGLLVRVGNGRAHKIEGNPKHPLNYGKTCARGQAGLQTLYNPDRLRNAVAQDLRGSRKFTAVEWETALETVTSRLKAARPGAIAFYSSRIDDSLAAVAAPLLAALGAAAPVFHDVLGSFGGRGTLSRIAGQMLGGQPNLPFFDLAGSDVVFSFGANLGETWLSPVAYGRAYGQMRGNALGKRGYLVQLEPRMSATGAVADEWIPIKPGTEGQVAMAIGKVLVDEGLGTAKNSPLAPLFKDVDVETIAAVSGVGKERLMTLARTFGKYARPTAIPGGEVAGQTNGASATAAILALNALAGHLAYDASAFWLTPKLPDAAFTAAAIAKFSDVQKLIDRMRAGEVDVLLVHGNPLFEIPAEAGFAEGLAKVPTVISFSSEVDETVVQSNLVLPDHSFLESWGYQIVTPPGDRPAISGQQPVVSALYDTRATADVLLDLAQRLGGAAKAALPYKNTVEFLQALLNKLVRQNAPYETNSLESVWNGWRQYGGWWPQDAAVTRPAVAPAIPATLTVPQADFVGDPQEFPFILFPYPSIALGDGRGASQSWLQETPDPMTTAMWDTWVEINPKTAEELGLKRNDVVKISTPTRFMLAVVYPYHGIRPDVVAVPIGQGHADYGRFAKNKGANVLGLISPKLTADGELAWGATRVKIEKQGRTRQLPVLESNVGIDAANEDRKFPG